MKLTVQYFDDCPNWKVLAERLREAVAGRQDVTIAFETVDTTEQAERVGFVGSPTLLVDGRDPFAEPGRPAGLACRVYQTPDGPAGLPSQAQLAEVLGPHLSADGQR